MITCIPYRIKFKYWDIHRAIKFGFQRMFRGYSNQELYSFYYCFVERYIKILKDFKKHNIAYPINLNEEQWDKILDEMIYHLEMMDEENVIKQLSKNMPDDFIPNYKTVFEIMERHRKEFFNLFSENFYNLWY